MLDINELTNWPEYTKLFVGLFAMVPPPIIMPLSNPTSHAEALPVDLISWTNGKALVATCSPFEDVEYSGDTYPIGQGNNAFIFPGLGHGASISGAATITDGMVMAAAEALAEYTRARPDGDKRIYPPIEAMPARAQRRILSRKMTLLIQIQYLQNWLN